MSRCPRITTRTSSQSESSNPNPRHSPANNVHSMGFEGCVDIVPYQASTNISRMRIRVIDDVGESVHRYLYSSGGRKLGICRMPTTFYLEIVVIIRKHRWGRHAILLTAKGVLVFPTMPSLVKVNICKWSKRHEVLTMTPMSAAVPGSTTHFASCILELAQWLTPLTYSGSPIKAMILDVMERSRGLERVNTWIINVAGRRYWNSNFRAHGISALIHRKSSYSASAINEEGHDKS